MSETPIAGNKPKWELKQGVWYEFTINPRDEFQFMHDGINRERKCWMAIKRCFLKGEPCQFFLLPEISMPQYGDSRVDGYKTTKVVIPRIHYHGVIRFPDEDSLLGWLLNGATNMALIGRYQFNPYRPDYWPGYCTKHQDLFSNLKHPTLTNLKHHVFPSTETSPAEYYKTVRRVDESVFQMLSDSDSQG